MKKTISAILVCALLVCSILTLVSCGKSISGKYSAEVDLIIGSSSVTYEFAPFGGVTVITNSLGKESVEEGKYELNDAGDKITLTFENEDGTKESETYDFVQGEENGVKYIKLGIVKYEKVD